MSRKVALVTGATSGLGLGVAKKFAERGVAVVGASRRKDGLEVLKSALGDAELAFISQDVTSKTAPRDAVELAKSKFGRLDYLVTSAGTSGSFPPVHKTTDEELDEYLAIHLRAPYRYAREALGVMGEGSAIVFMSSVWAQVGTPRGGPYSTAKAGLTGLTYTMAADYGPKGIRTNTVAPGVIPTPMTEQQIQFPPFNRLMMETVPFNRQGTVDDVANLVVYLCSDEAGFINGQVIAIDGGWSTTNYLPKAALVAERSIPK
jgi:meso-butanediol dehydrogenase/(S,S)-butanediol dehydrogenase/diacetyl reductase